MKDEENKFYCITETESNIINHYIKHIPTNENSFLLVVVENKEERDRLQEALSILFKNLQHLEKFIVVSVDELAQLDQKLVLSYMSNDHMTKIRISNFYCWIKIEASKILYLKERDKEFTTLEMQQALKMSNVMLYCLSTKKSEILFSNNATKSYAIYSYDCIERVVNER